MLLQDLPKIAFAALLTISAAGCLPIPYYTDGIRLKGEVYDVYSYQPIEKAEVEIDFPDDVFSTDVKSDNQGKFEAESSGEWRWYVLLFSERDDDWKKIGVLVQHPDYEPYKAGDWHLLGDKAGRDVDVGSVYLERK